jgi:hypothetical protein
MAGFPTGTGTDAYATSFSLPFASLFAPWRLCVIIGVCRSLCFHAGGLPELLFDHNDLDG